MKLMQNFNTYVRILVILYLYILTIISIFIIILYLCKQFIKLQSFILLFLIYYF